VRSGQGGDKAYRRASGSSGDGRLRAEIEACLDHFAGSHRDVTELVRQLDEIATRLRAATAPAPAPAMADALDGLTDVIAALAGAGTRLTEVRRRSTSYLDSLR